ncbi:MAG: type II secretion system protein J [Elainellaceae cyanobacterium]
MLIRKIPGPRGAQKAQAGFTFTELLVVMLLAGGIVSLALYLASTLLAADQHHMGRAEVHTNLQRSLDYMARDLQQAVYVYEGACLGDGLSNEGGCPGLVHHLPTTLVPERDRFPVLAFWRPAPLSQTLVQRCRQGRLVAPECQSQQTYLLVVYVVSPLDQSGIWQGEARLQRYTLNQFRQSGAPVPGYVVPRRYQFRIWPWAYVNSATLVNQQESRPSLRGSAPVPLVDFIDFSASGGQACPAGYQPTAAAAVLAQVDSVLGCVAENGRQQTVMLTLRGDLPASARAPAQTVTLQRQAFPQAQLDYLSPD